MPLYTKKYGLAAFNTGDVYSSSEDRRRFKIIDNQLAFLSDLVGNGVVDGWSIVDEGSGSAGNPVISCDTQDVFTVRASCSLS